MKKTLLTTLILLFFLATPTHAQVGERIENYEVSIEIQKTGEILVEETIRYNFGSNERHGIFRNIPYLKTNSDGERFAMEIDLIEVTDVSGKPYQVQKTKEGEDLKLRIGDPDKTITGTHTYNISYEVSGAISYFSDHDELYWNAVGTEWEVPIENSSVKINYPQTESLDYDFICFTGREGEDFEGCFVEIIAGQANFQLSERLKPGEGFTIVASFPKGLIKTLKPTKVQSFEETLGGKIALLAIGLAFLFWYLLYPLRIIWKWYLEGRDPEVGRPIEAYFDPPKTKEGKALTPAQTGALVDERIQHKEVIATIIDLARRGYLEITEKEEGEFTLKKKSKDQEEYLWNFEKKLLNDLFEKTDTVDLEDKSLVKTFKEVEEMIYKTLTGEFFNKNPNKVRNFYSAIGVAAIFTFNPALVLTSFLFGRNMIRKTVYGAKEANKALALKNFLKSQERQLNFQAENQMMFEKLLPFAIAFGVEKVWIERFKGLGVEQPDWYNTAGSRGSFNTAIFANSLDSSINSMQSSATPVSSSSGFSSGFSGGSVGGGGGGGGGGSW